MPLYLLGHLDRVIKELSKHIGRDWKRLARELGFLRTDIDAIEVKDRGDLREQIHGLFEGWKMREGRNASVEKLVTALRNAELQAVLDEMEDILSGTCFFNSLHYTHSYCCVGL